MIRGCSGPFGQGLLNLQPPKPSQLRTSQGPGISRPADAGGGGGVGVHGRQTGRHTWVCVRVVLKRVSSQHIFV